MAAPTYVTGQVLAASDCNNWFTGLYAYKTSATVRSTLTLAIDPDLQFSLAASAFYEIRAGIIYTGASGSFKFGWTFPSGVTGGFTVALPQGTLMPTGFTWASTSAGATDGTVYGLQVMGNLATSSTAGTFGLQWSSNAGPASLTCGIGSYLIAQRVG